MRAVQKRFGKTDGVVALHAYQSFREGEVTPEQCHKIGVALARKVWGKRFDPVAWYSTPGAWPIILVIVNLWKNIGYQSIIFMAAISGIDKSLFEAAAIDGASKLRQIRSITLPLLKPTIITLTLMSVGRIFYSDFGLFYQVPQNSGAIFATTQTIDTYVYRGLMERTCQRGHRESRSRRGNFCPYCPGGKEKP